MSDREIWRLGAEEGTQSPYSLVLIHRNRPLKSFSFTAHLWIFKVGIGYNPGRDFLREIVGGLAWFGVSFEIFRFFRINVDIPVWWNKKMTTTESYRKWQKEDGMIDESVADDE